MTAGEPGSIMDFYNPPILIKQQRINQKDLTTFSKAKWLKRNDMLEKVMYVSSIMCISASDTTSTVTLQWRKADFCNEISTLYITEKRIIYKLFYFFRPSVNTIERGT